MPATVRLQQIGGGAGQQKWRAQVGLQDTVLDIHGQLVQFGERDADVLGGVVHKDVQAPMARLNLLNTGFNGCRVPLVQLQVRGFAALVMDGLHSGTRGFLGTDIGDNNLGALSRKCSGNCLTDIAGTACNQRHFSVQCHLLFLFSVSERYAWQTVPSPNLEGILVHDAAP